MSFKDCYKNVINSLTDWTAWNDINAKLIDLCTDSYDEDITLYEWKPFTQSYSSYWFSDGTRYGSGCLKLPIQGFTGYVTQAVSSYIFNALSQ